MFSEPEHSPCATATATPRARPRHRPILPAHGPAAGARGTAARPATRRGGGGGRRGRAEAGGGRREDALPAGRPLSPTCSPRAAPDVSPLLPAPPPLLSPPRRRRPRCVPPPSLVCLRSRLRCPPGHALAQRGWESPPPAGRKPSQARPGAGGAGGGSAHGCALSHGYERGAPATSRRSATDPKIAWETGRRPHVCQNWEVSASRAPTRA